MAARQATCGTASDQVEPASCPRTKVGESSLERRQRISALYLTSRRSLHRFLLSLTKSPDIAEDLLQEVYARYCAADRSGPINRPESFLKMIAYNLAVDHWRRRENSPIDDRYDYEAATFCQDLNGFEDGVIARQELRLAWGAISKLTPRARQVFTLRRIGDLSFKEIANELGISVSTAEKHMSNAKTDFDLLVRAGGAAPLADLPPLSISVPAGA